MTAIILAGGRGTRLKSAVDNTPKPLLPVAGKPFLHWVARWAEAQGEHDIVVAGGYLGEQMTRWSEQETRERPGCRVRTRVEQQPLGTGGAVRFAAKGLDDDVYLILNGDSLIVTSVKHLRMLFASDPMLDGVIISKRTNDVARYGSLVFSADGYLVRFSEKATAGTGLINGGVYLLRHRLINRIAPGPSSIERDCFPSWLQTGARIRVAVADAPFIDIGTPETLAAASDFIDDNRELFESPDLMAPADLVGDGA